MDLGIRFRKDAIAGFMAMVMLFLSIPMNNLLAAPKETGTGTAVIYLVSGGDSIVGEEGITFTADELLAGTTKTVTAKVQDVSGNDVSENNLSSVWSSLDEEVATVADGEIIPIGAGETVITYEGSYRYTVSEGDAETVVDGAAAVQIPVKVYEKPQLAIVIAPAEEATYPQEVKISVTGNPEGVEPELWIGKSGEELQKQESAFLTETLEAGTYTIKAATEESGFYVAAETEISYTVNKGAANIAVSPSGGGEVYYSESITYTVSTNGEAGIISVSSGDATIDGAVSASVDKDKTEAEFTVKFDKTVGTNHIEFAFVPENENMEQPANTVVSVEVKKIPVEAYWNEDFTKTYDGEATYVPGEPALRLSGVSDLSINTTVSYGDLGDSGDSDGTGETLHAFCFSSADAGTYEATYAGTLAITDEEHYQLVNPVPTVEVVVEPITLTAENVNAGAGTGKYYDGESTAVFAEVPGLVNADCFVEGEFAEFVLGYTADYYDTDEASVVYGDATEDVEADAIKITNFKVLDVSGNASVNYVFAAGTEVVLAGQFTIRKNADFEAFTGMDLGEPVDGVYWFHEDYPLEKEGYQFSIVNRESLKYWFSRIPYDWKNELTITSETDGKKISAATLNSKGKVDKISDEIVIGYDAIAPNGAIYAQITRDGEEKETTSITELVDTYNTIEKNSVIEIIIAVEDTKSKLKEIEWYATNTSVSANDATTWPASGTNLITVDAGTEQYDSAVVTIDKTELKAFYYAKVTDNAGNVAYISSSGVLQDVTNPTVEAVTLGTADGTYNNVNVYDKGTIPFAVTLQETGITSGISDVKVELSLNDRTVAEYSITDSMWTVSSGDVKDAVTGIRTLHSTVEPTNTMIDNASGTLSVEGTLEDLADGNAYTLTVTAYDKAGNVSEKATQQFIIDSQAPEVAIDLSGLKKNDNRQEDTATPDGLFTSGEVVITIADMTLVTELSTLLSDIKGFTWESAKGADGFVTYTAKIPFGKGTVNTEAVYTLAIDVKDSLYGLEGHENTSVAKSINIDGTAPVYSLTYSAPAQKSVKVENTYYYNKDIVAAFEITEEGSYDDALFTITVKNDAQETVMEWADGEATTVSGNDLYVLKHEADSKIFTLEILADEVGHSTDNSGYTFSIAGQDKAGNRLKAQAADNGIAEIRAMDTTAPDLKTVTYDTIAAFTTVSEGDVVRDYVNADTAVSVTVAESNPIVSEYTLTSEGEAVIVPEWIRDTATETYSTAIAVPQLGEKGDEQTLALTVWDVAGNAAVLSAEKRSQENTAFAAGTYTDKFTVDKVYPTIAYEYLEYSPNKLNVLGVDYFNHPITVQVTVEEHNFNESLIPVMVSGYGSGVEFEESAWTTSGNDLYMKEFTFSEDSEYHLTISGNDCADNTLQLVAAEDITATSVSGGDTGLTVAIDKTLPTTGDDAKPVIVISPGSSSGNASAIGDYSEHSLYNDSVVYEVAVYDPKTNEFCSGIDEITFSVSAESGASATAAVSTDGTITNGSGVSVSLASGDAATLAKGKDNQYVFHVTIDETTFNSNNIVLSVNTKDLSTNTTGKTAGPVAIDVTAPIVAVSYDNNSVSNERFFKEVRVATIEVTERNFNDSCMSFVVNGENVGLNFTCVSTGSGNRDDAIWRATYAFENDNDYTIECSVRDAAGNGGTVGFSGEAPESFTVDRTVPVISLSYDNNSAWNDYYYDAGRTATITIQEHNFNAENVVITGTATDNGATVSFPVLSGWSSNGDTRVARLRFENDARYTLDVAYTDLASNEAVPPQTSVFVIDNLNPEITISGVEEGVAYAGEVAPTVEFADTNYADYEIVLTRTERERHGIDVTDSFVEEATIVYSSHGRGTGINVIEDIEHIAENDGIYTLTVRVYDKAGRSEEAEVVYSVNRFGSVYVYSDDLSALISGYHQDITGDLYIRAYNTNELVADSTKLQVTCDGATVDGQKSAADAKADLEDSDNWYVYQFEIDASDFEQDGAYEVTLSDMDKAGNTRTNSDEPIRFYVDATAPVLDSVIGLETDIINAEEQQVAFTVSDAIGLKNVAVYVDNVMVKSIDEFEVATYCADEFTLGAGMRQSIRIVVEDKAGNILDTSTQSFVPAFSFSPVVTVSTNVLVRWYANTALFWGSIAGVAGAVVLVALLLYAVRKKKVTEDE